MKQIFLALCLLSLALTSNAQELSFNRKGEFKIVQFTDTHFCLGNPKSDIALEIYWTLLLPICFSVTSDAIPGFSVSSSPS